MAVVVKMRKLLATKAWTIYDVHCAYLTYWTAQSAAHVNVCLPEEELAA